MHVHGIGELFGYKHCAINDTNHDVFVLLKRTRTRIVLYNLYTQTEIKVTNHIFESSYSPLSKSVRASQAQKPSVMAISP
jgi:hypothetical protein